MLCFFIYSIEVLDIQRTIFGCPADRVDCLADVCLFGESFFDGTCGDLLCDSDREFGETRDGRQHGGAGGVRVNESAECVCGGGDHAVAEPFCPHSKHAETDARVDERVVRLSDAVGDAAKVNGIVRDARCNQCLSVRPSEKILRSRFGEFGRVAEREDDGARGM